MIFPLALKQDRIPRPPDRTGGFMPHTGASDANATPASLLHRLRQPADRRAWDEFAELYVPVLFQWARAIGLQDADAADLVQDVFAHLMTRLPVFDYDRDGSFRGWLRTVLVNRRREQLRRRRPTGLDDVALANLADSEVADPFASGVYRQALLRQALGRLKGTVSDLHWRAFEAVALDGRPAPAVARELGLSLNAVYVAKSRMLQTLREELAGLLD